MPNYPSPFPSWENVVHVVGSGAAIGSVTNVTSDWLVMDRQDGIYIPPGTYFCASITFPGYTITAPYTLTIDYIFTKAGEQVKGQLTMVADPVGSVNMAFRGIAGSSTVTIGSLSEGDGTVPYGFVRFVEWQTNFGAMPTGNPTMRFGWTTSDVTNATAPSGTVVAMYPLQLPPEFQNSVVPYSGTRLNASAMQLLNATAKLSIEGTAVAARLRCTQVDPWMFGVTDLNSVVPFQRYSGLLSDGLYTFTAPENVDLVDCVYLGPAGASTGCLFKTTRPVWTGPGLSFNAIVLSDLGTSASATQLLVNMFSHLEFETTSALFTVSVARSSLESLHQCEVQMLTDGFFKPARFARFVMGKQSAEKKKRKKKKRLENKEHAASKPHPKPAPKPKAKKTASKPNK